MDRNKRNILIVNGNGYPDSGRNDWAKDPNNLCTCLSRFVKTLRPAVAMVHFRTAVKLLQGNAGICN